MSKVANLKVAPASEPEPEPEKAPTPARDIRRARAMRLGAWLLICVGLPLLSAIVYYGFWAAPQYESVALFVVVDHGKADHDQTRSGRDALMTQRYIGSRTMLDELVKSHGLVAMYQDGRADYWSRLPAGASSERLFEHYRERVTVSHDSASETLELVVRAYDGDQAQAIGRAIVASSRDMLARVDNGSGRHQLVVVSEPSRPDGATHPRRLRSIATVAVVASTLMGVFMLLGAAIREHAKF